MTDAINPSHYKQGSIECIEAMEQILTPEEFRGYLKGNVFKYLWRERKKKGIEDLRKAKWYLDRLVASFDDLLAEINAPILEGEPPKPSRTQPPSGYRMLGDAKSEPRIEGDSYWSVGAKGWFPLVEELVRFANHDNWAACRKVWRSSDNVSLAMQIAANSFGGKGGVFNGASFSNAMRQLAGVNCNLDGHVVATILGDRSDVEVLKGGSHYRYLFYEPIDSSLEPTEQPVVKQTLTTAPPRRYREPTLEDLKNGPIECEYRGDDGEQWRSGFLVYILKGVMPFLCTDKEELLCGQWEQCLIEVQE